MNYKTDLDYQYVKGGSLPANHPTYVRRQADEDLYRSLKAGDFCYVLNARQMGKSSLRVQTMQRLQGEGVACAAIDLTAIGSQVTPEQWYFGIANRLARSLRLSGQFNLKTWWSDRGLLSPLQRLGDLVEDVLLKLVAEPIVIFFDEIDGVLGFDFPTDDFFAFIRFCYNQRADRPEYNRLSFCLLGVATPSELIADKRRTPFNVGKAIELTGFSLEEASKALTPGLAKTAENPEKILAQILNWTGGQPFLTQKLCQIVVENCQGGSANVSRLVKTHITENWEALDEPEHLRTIRDRLLKRSEQRSADLLELYRLLWQQELKPSNSTEEAELRLSGLAISQQGKLKIASPIYRAVFDLDWIETELANLRPYAEAFRLWVDSGCKDESRLLRGRALSEALKWAEDKGLGTLDREFLGASQSVERIDRKVRIGNFLLTIISLASIFLLGWTNLQLDRMRRETEMMERLSDLGGQLQKKDESSDAAKVWKKAGLSNEIDDPRLRRAFRLSSVSWVHQKLEELDEAEKASLESLELIRETVTNDTTSDELQIRIYAWSSYGRLLQRQGNNPEALAAYQEAFEILQLPIERLFHPQSWIFTIDSVTSLHRRLSRCISDSSRGRTDRLTVEQVDRFMQNFHLSYLKYLLASKRWKEADGQTSRAIYNISNTGREAVIENMDKLSDEPFRSIDQLWLRYSNGRFGFSVQKQIYEGLGGNSRKLNSEIWESFGDRVGWRKEGKWISPQDITYTEAIPEAHLPSWLMGDLWFPWLLRDIKTDPNRIPGSGR